MSGVAADYTHKAASLSRKLRQIQAGLADAPEETRLVMLAQELDRELGDQSDQARRSMLEIALSDFSSGYGSSGAGQASPGAALAQSPEAMADNLLAAFSKMSEVDRQKMLDRLTPILPPTKGVDRDAVVRDVAAFFKMPPEQLQPQRVGELCAILLRLVRDMEPVWQIWDELARTVMRPAETPTITQAAPGFLANSSADQMEKERISQEGRRLGRVVIQLLLGFKPASKKFADDLSKDLLPRKFEDQAKKESTTFSSVQPWEVYKKQPTLYDKDELCDRVLDAVRELVQRNLR